MHFTKAIILSLILIFGSQTFGSWTSKNCSGEQSATIDTFSTEAFQCLTKAKDKIEKDWEKLKLKAKWTGTPKSYSQVLFVEGNREFYLSVINSALRDNVANGVRYQCERSCPEDRVAYTNFNFGMYPVKPIYFCPLYFSSIPNATVVIHELGRLYGSISGDSELDKTNIYVWDKIITVLCQD